MRERSKIQSSPVLRGAAMLSVGMAVVMTGLGGAAANPEQQGAFIDPPLSRYQTITAKRRAVLKDVLRRKSALVNVTADITPSTPELTWLGKRALPALEWGLTNNTNAEVRQRLVSVLWDFADPQSLKSLMVAARDWNQLVRSYAVQALGAVGSFKAEKLLLHMAKDRNEDESIRATALESLGRMGSRRSVGLILRILRAKKTSYALRWMALRALWHLRFVIPESSLRVGLAYALGKDQSQDFALFAAGAAAMLRIRSLRGALEHRLFSGPLSVQNAAAYALGEIGDKRAIAALRRRLPTVRSTRLLNNILFALAKLQDRKRIGLIESLLQSRQATIRLNVAFVAGDLKDKRLVPALMKAVGDSSRSVQVSAVQALAKIGDPSSVDVLDRAASRGPVDVSLMALKTLYHLNPNRYEGVLVGRYLRDRRSWVRCDAAAILAQRGRRVALPVLLRCTDSRTFRWLKKRLRAYPAWTWEGYVVASAVHAVMGGGRLGGLVETLGGLALKPGHLQVLRSLVPLTWTSPGLRSGLVRLLGMQQDRKASPEFWRVAKTRHVPTRYRAWFALGNLGYRQGWERLLTALTQAAPSVKRSLFNLLSSFSNKDARRAVASGLRKALQGHGISTTLAAAAALLAYDPPKGLSILVGGLTDRRQEVRAEAAFYLTRARAKGLLAALRKAEQAERSPMRRAAVRGIANRIDPHVFVPRLVRNLPF